MAQNIDQAAITLFNEIGEHFTLDQLSQETKLSRATLYRHIGSKEALLKELSSKGEIQYIAQLDIKDRILVATQKVVARQGFINCTMEQIATEAGLGIATIYRHFSEKEKLLLAFTNNFKSKLNLNPKPPGSYHSMQEDLEVLVANLLKNISENKDLVKIIFFGNPNERKYINNIRANSDSIFSAIAKYLQNYQAQGHIANNLKIDDLTTILIGQLMQFSLTSPVHFDRPVNIKKDAKTIVNIFCKGVQVNDEANTQ